MVTNYATPSDGRIYELEQKEKILNLIKQKYPKIYFECLEECIEDDRIRFEAND